MLGILFPRVTFVLTFLYLFLSIDSNPLADKPVSLLWTKLISPGPGLVLVALKAVKHFVGMVLCAPRCIS